MTGEFSFLRPNRISVLSDAVVVSFLSMGLFAVVPTHTAKFSHALVQDHVVLLATCLMLNRDIPASDSGYQKQKKFN